MIDSERVLAEMAVMKMPDGTKRARSKSYTGIHDITVDGEHAGTIAGHHAGHGAPGYAKVYTVHKNEEASLKAIHTHDEIKKGKWGHPDHQHEYKLHTVDGKGNPTSFMGKQPRQYHSMDEAIHHVVAAHRNNKEFGAGHSPETRWAHASSKLASLKAHDDVTHAHTRAAQELTRAGHHDLAAEVTNRLEAHKASAAGMGETKAKIKQWLHDTKFHTQHTSTPERVSAAHAASTAAYNAGVNVHHAY